MSNDNLTPPPPPASPVGTPSSGVPTGAKKGLSLTAFILGIASVVLFIFSWFAAVIGLVAVILGFIGRSKEPGAPRWMWLLGIILGFVGIVIGVIVGVLAIAAVNYIQQHGQLTN